MKFEVLVVGGGPAGSTAAKFLAQEGIETCLIERNLEFRKPCGGGIPSSGLKDFDILYDIQKELNFNIARKVKIVPPFSPPIEVKLINGEIFIFDRYEFDSFLRKLAQSKGAYLFEGELLNIEEGKTIKSIFKTKNGETLCIESKYLIAADGINSRVCSLTGIKKPDFFWTVSFQIHLSNFFDHSINQDTCEFWFGSSHASFFYSWIFPGKDYLSIGTGTKKANMLRNFIDNFIKRRFSNSIDISKIKLRAFKIPRWSKRNFYRKNILLCGDALGTVMPVSFEGIYYAMKSGQFAAEAVRQRKLSIYEKLWNDRFEKQFLIMKKFQDYMFGNDERIDKWLNIHRNSHIQELAMTLWLRKEKRNKLIPLYLKAFSSLISRIAIQKVKINK